MRQNTPSARRRRPPFALFPVLLLLWGFVLWGIVSGLIPRLFGGIDSLADGKAQALAALQQGDTRKADDTLERTAQLLVQNGVPIGEAYATVGDEMTRAGQGTAAARFLARATQRPELDWDPLIWSSLAAAYTSANNIAAAKPAAAAANRRAAAVVAAIGKPTNGDPNTAALRQMETGLYYSDRKKDAPNALRALREAYRLLPDDIEVINALGYTLADLGTTQDEWDEAVILTRRAVKSEPENASILDSYGWALFRRNDFAGARRVLRQAADALGDNAEVHYHLGSVYARLGEATDAARELNRALQIRPKYPEAEQAKAALTSPAPHTNEAPPRKAALP